ncbi:hypothetical protein NQ314_009439 [Rhamnusium bicolor]|uniref:SWIM-type domain-containing protein n=1 Tax=Rhamnusium bicolor TaxID=1586634 RepID=A0AAV8Y104_9CUCU|nr:hypothetical protein NQ314_009439 [Rhamnusium bicolor]
MDGLMDFVFENNIFEDDLEVLDIVDFGFPRRRLRKNTLNVLEEIEHLIEYPHDWQILVQRQLLDLEKIKVLQCDPYNLKDSDFDFGLDSIPPITNMDIVTYLVLTHSYYTKEQMKGYKSLVQHSMKAREPKLKVWIITEKNSEVCTAHCTCMAGLGEACSHIAAALYAAEHATNIKKNISCTDITAAWPVPSQSGVQPTTVASMDWGKSTESKTSIEVPPIKNEELCEMLQEISSESEAVLMRIVEPFASQISKENAPRPLPLLFNIHDKNHEKKSLEELISVEKSLEMHVTQEMKTEIERRTQGQRKSEEWYRQRSGRITASMFKNVCHSSIINPSLSLIKSVCYPQKVCFSTKETRWGIEHEVTAIHSYYSNMHENHENFIVNNVGLVVSEKWPQLGATPDGLVYCDCCLGDCLEFNVSIMACAKKMVTLALNKNLADSIRRQKQSRPKQLINKENIDEDYVLEIEGTNSDSESEDKRIGKIREKRRFDKTVMERKKLNLRRLKDTKWVVHMIEFVKKRKSLSNVQIIELHVVNFFEWCDHVSMYKLNEINPRPYLSNMVEINFERGTNTLKYNTDFKGPETELNFLTAKSQKMGITKPVHKTHPRGIIEERKNQIIKKLCEIMPPSRLTFWQELPVSSTTSNDLTDDEL